MMLEMLNDVDYLYEPVSHAYNTKDKSMIHISEGKYRICRHEFGVLNPKFEVVFETRSADAFLNEFNERKLDLSQLENHLLKALLDEGVHATLRLEKVKKYFTEEDIERHLSDWREFARQITSHIEKHTKNE